jgi:hypothetical protein
MQNTQVLRSSITPWWERDPMPEGWRIQIRFFMKANANLIDVCLRKDEIPRSYIFGGVRTNACRGDFWGLAIFVNKITCLCGSTVELQSTGQKNYGSKISMRKGVCSTCGLAWHLRSNGNLYWHPLKERDKNRIRRIIVGS